MVDLGNNGVERLLIGFRQDLEHNEIEVHIHENTKYPQSVQNQSSPKENNSLCEVSVNQSRVGNKLTLTPQTIL